MKVGREARGPRGLRVPSPPGRPPGMYGLTSRGRARCPSSGHVPAAIAEGSQRLSQPTRFLPQPRGFGKTAPVSQAAVVDDVSSVIELPGAAFNLAETAGVRRVKRGRPFITRTACGHVNLGAACPVCSSTAVRGLVNDRAGVRPGDFGLKANKDAAADGL